jgi:hypothetical protein
VERYAEYLEARKKTITAVRTAVERGLRGQELEHYESHKNIILGVVTHMFREDVVHHAIRRNTGFKSWDAAFANVTLSLDADSFRMMDMKRQVNHVCPCFLVNDDPRMSGVKVEDVASALAKCAVPIHFPAGANREKLRLLRTIQDGFTFHPDDGLDKVLFESMTTVLEKQAEKKILRAAVAEFKKKWREGLST